MRHASVDLGSACKWPSYSARWVAMETMQFYVIQTAWDLFSEKIRSFGIEWSHWTISHPWVIVLGCKISLISPLPRCVCVWGGGGAGCQIVIPWSYLHFNYINIHGYANEKILYVTIVWKDLLNCITDDIITCNKDSLGQISVYICFFLWFSLIFWNFHQYWWLCKLDN